MKVVGSQKAVLIVVLAISAAAVGWAYTRYLNPPFPGVTAQAQSTTVRAGSQPTIHAPTYAEAVNALLSRQYAGQGLTHVTITNIQTLNHTYVAQVLFHYKRHLFMDAIAAVQQRGTDWLFQSLQGLGRVNPRVPMIAIPMGGQITPASTNYIFIAGYVNRRDIQYVVLHFPTSPTVRIAVSRSHTFAYLSTMHRGPSSIDAFSASHHLVYRWG